MANFEALISAKLDLNAARSELSSFISQQRQIDIGVNLQLNSANQALNSILMQMQNQGGNAGRQFSTSFVQNMNNGLQQIENQNNRMTINIRNNMRNLNQQQRQFNETTARTFDNQMTAWARTNSKAINATMRDSTQTYGQALSELHNRLGQAITNQDTATVRQIREEFRLLQSEARATGNVGKTLGESFSSALGSVTRFAASYLSVYRVFNTLKEGAKTVVELDNALVDLQKTSSATPKQLESFYRDANNIAKEYGTTTQQIIQGAAD